MAKSYGFKVFLAKKVLKNFRYCTDFQCIHYVSGYEAQKRAQKLQIPRTLLLFLLFLSTEKFLKSAASFWYKKESHHSECKQHCHVNKKNFIIDLSICGIHPFHPRCLSMKGGTDKSLVAVIER